MQFPLSEDEKSAFERDGWIGPFRAIDAAEGEALGPKLRAWQADTVGHPFPHLPEGESVFENDDRPWYQAMHAELRRVYEIGKSPAVLDRIRQVIGDDVILWGASYFGQGQHETIHWHADLEYQLCDGVSIWLALHDVTPENVLKIIPGSQRFPETPETLMTAGAPNSWTIKDFQSDEFVLDLAKQWTDEPRIVRPHLESGEFILFRGRMWHGSYNPQPVYREALNLRFAQTSEVPKITVNFVHPARWDPLLPPSILMSGEDRFGHNRLVDPPAA